jgi:RND superfamily putative drug exporter
VTPHLYRLGGFCARHRWAVLAVWLIILIGLGGWARAAGQSLNDDLSLPGTDSQAATDLLDQRFPAQANGMNPIVLVAPPGHKVTDQQYKAPIDDSVKAMQANPIVVNAINPLSDSGSSQVSKDKGTAYIALNLNAGPGDLTEEQAQQLLDQAKPAEKAGLEVSAGGYVGQQLSQPSTESSEIVGLSVAIVVLLLTFGTFVAMGLPIITAIFGLASGLSIITLLSHVISVPTVGPTLATMIGLGVGIDYALFVVTRHRTQIHGGMDVRESIARATASSGGAVVFAGCTVIIALASLAVVGLPLVRTLGFMAALVVLVAILGAITLLPALLSAIGSRIDALPLPLMGVHKASGKPGVWSRWGAYVARHPLPALLVALIVLVLLALPMRSLYLGQQDNGSLPKDTQSRQAYDALAAGFGVGLNGPFLISVDLSKKPAEPDQQQLDQINQQEKQQKQKANEQAQQQEQQLVAQGLTPQQAQAQVSPKLEDQLNQIDDQAESQRKKASNPATDPRLQTLRKDLQGTDGVQSVSQPLVNKSGTAAVLNLIPTTSPSDRKTADLVETLRDDVIPPAIKGSQMEVYVGGTTAAYVDLADEIGAKLPQTIGLVIILSFLLLVLAFRSLVIPLTAAVMNIISIAAAFGVVTAVFEKGWGIQLVGLEHDVPIVSFVPLMMFAVLFGLSMDYEVFLISHMREAWSRTRDNHASVVEGIGSTGRVITSAALIMVSVFFAFILNGDPTVKQFGVGMGVAVAVDATLVRCLLVPATMVLIGKANWWFPRWMERAVPNFSIEGEGWFRERDAAAARAAQTETEPAHAN